MRSLHLKIANCVLVSTALGLGGCTFMAASGDINDGSVDATSARDHDARMRRMREGGTLRPGEYEALRQKIGDGSQGEVTPKPSIEELEKRVETERESSRR